MPIKYDQVCIYTPYAPRGWGMGGMDIKKSRHSAHINYFSIITPKPRGYPSLRSNFSPINPMKNPTSLYIKYLLDNLPPVSYTHLRAHED